MTPSPLKNLAIVHHFAALPDPRVQRTRRHSLNDIIVIAICGFVCGCKSWEQVAVYGRQHAAWFGTFLELPNGMPSKDTFRRVFARLKPALSNWPTRPADGGLPSCSRWSVPRCLHWRAWCSASTRRSCSARWPIAVGNSFSSPRASLRSALT